MIVALSTSIITIKSMVSNRSSISTTPRSMSAFDARFSLVLALAAQTSSLSQRVLMNLATETAKYVIPRRFESRNLEEALMAVPDLETVNFVVLSRIDQYEIREVEPFFIAETTMPGKYGFDFNGASQSFNVLAEYLFGKNTMKESMEMTTPVFTRKTQSDGERMEMTTPVITRKVSFFLPPVSKCKFSEKCYVLLEDQGKWQMSFIMPSKYGANLPLPKDSSVRITEVPRKIVAVAAFSVKGTSNIADIDNLSSKDDLILVLVFEPGFVTDDEVTRRESKLKDALKNDPEFQVKEGASVEVAQYNPPFTLPFTRRNEIALEVERKTE
ncbi:hypothetical protein RHGRI_011251 [Rhododendron griersonianum]|uniref:SOUL heme-binding family protein n=1 Tax=Rhododendron griersonianum TaxID=479676 RepID=A0AAV6KL56_9ERIC|nr:hypothetical protein RHGRI_011251 [Rhododendron griersonianum]